MREREAVSLPTRVLGEAVWRFGERRANLIVEGEENFAPAREHLKEGSLIIGINHRSYVDPGGAIMFIDNYLPEATVCLFPASYKHLDAKRIPLEGRIAKGVAHVKGFKLLPVVQHYDRSSYSKDFILGLDKQFVKEARRVLQTPGGVLVVAPEGTRSRTGQLQPAQPGIENLFRWSEKTFFQPIGFIETSVRNVLLSRPMKAVVGPLYSPEEIFDFAQNKNLEVKDALMVLLAQLLPKEYHGVYAQYL